ncbi:MAG: NADH-quinone oxidoreductase subunit J [Cyclobacteriaceae bacterium]|jgi:NADH-quinone oxidoreductase subunit J
MTFTNNLFYFLSFVAVLSALMVVFSKNPVHSVLYLIITFFAIAGHYVLLNAQFLAAVHVIVYAGAIMVLFLYVIMLLNLNHESDAHKSTVMKLAGTISAGLLLVVLVGSIRGSEQMMVQPQQVEVGSVKDMGRILFKEFLLPFEISSVLLLVAMIGAVMLGKNEEEGKNAS